MASCYENVALFQYNVVKKSFDLLIEDIDLRLEISTPDLILFISNKSGETIEIKFNISKLNCCRLSSLEILIDSETKKIGNCELSSFLLQFQSEDNANELFKKIDSCKLVLKSIREKNDSIFDIRTENWSATQYFQFYSYLSQQQNMMQDYIRTSTYQRAVLSNCLDFRNKVVLDVGAGSGILSFFAAQAGAKRVYAVEASNMAKYCEQLVQNNKLAGKIIIVSGKIEEINVPEPVDILISEPMGYMLFNERMLETYVHAKKFLKKDVPKLMFPTVANLYVAPFSDESIYMEQANKANFWYQQSFHGVDLSSVREAANKENFGQPIVDTFDIGVCMSPPISHKVDFREISEQDLYIIDIPLKFTIQQTGCCHGLAIWFDVGFLGTQKNVWLSTGPTEPLTHWYQVRCLFMTPLFVYEGQVVMGKMLMNANARQSYDVDIELSLPGTTCKVTNTLDLKNPYFRYTGQPIQPPPGNQTKSPTETYFSIYNSGNCGNSKSQVAWSGDVIMTSENNVTQPNQLINSTSPFSPQLRPDYE